MGLSWGDAGRTKVRQNSAIVAWLIGILLVAALHAIQVDPTPHGRRVTLWAHRRLSVDSAMDHPRFQMALESRELERPKDGLRLRGP